MGLRFPLADLTPCFNGPMTYTINQIELLGVTDRYLNDIQTFTGHRDWGVGRVQ